MAEYHVRCGAFGIYAGTLEPKNKSLWRNKSDVTEEAIEAVRDHMVMELLGTEYMVQSIIMTGVFILLIYGGYFVITYNSCKNMIKNI